ncbi:MAG TPA: ABC transporter ATP-binding protein [Chryseosolibacter sp.]|nr:ABC transporter ATP-binding protein [Chryseosolibacter sp.]
MFLKVDHIGFEEGGNKILHDVFLTQTRIQKLALVGETGSGKSTLLKIIAGLLQADHGEVLLEGERIKGPREKLVAGHDHIHYLSQHFELPKFLRVEQILEYANVLTTEKADALFTVCDISHLLGRKTDELSGGEKQRIALARILIASPKLILLDEPFSNLDMVHKTVLQQVILKISKQLKIACVLVSHDPDDVLPWADQIVVMRNGAIVQKGPPEEIYRMPVDEYVAGLFGKYNVIEDRRLLKKLGLAGATIVRPHQIYVVKKSENTLKAQIEDVKFHGAFYEMKASIHGIVLHLNSPTSYQPGDVVYVRVRKD